MPSFQELDIYIWEDRIKDVHSKPVECSLMGWDVAGVGDSVIMPDHAFYFPKPLGLRQSLSSLH